MVDKSKQRAESLFRRLHKIKPKINKMLYKMVMTMHVKVFQLFDLYVTCFHQSVQYLYVNNSKYYQREFI